MIINSIAPINNINHKSNIKREQNFSTLLKPIKVFNLNSSPNGYYNSIAFRGTSAFQASPLFKEYKASGENGFFEFIKNSDANSDDMFDFMLGETLIVDNGHAKFSNVLRPGVKMIHMGLQDLYGRDFITLEAGLNRANELNLIDK